MYQSEHSRSKVKNEKDDCVDCVPHSSRSGVKLRKEIEEGYCFDCFPIMSAFGGEEVRSSSKRKLDKNPSEDKITNIKSSSKKHANFKCESSRYRLFKSEEKEDKEGSFRSRSKGKTLKLSSDSSETDDVQSVICEVLYTFEAGDLFNSEKNATSFVILVVDPSRKEQPLPVCFKHIVYNTKIQPGFLKLQTYAGLSWMAQLVKQEDNYLLNDGWKVLVDQMAIGLGSYILFEYDGMAKFNITIYQQYQSLQVGNSFYSVLLDRSNDEIPLPTGFLSYNFANEVPEVVNLKGSENQMWKLKIKQDGKDSYIHGWKKVVDEIPIHLFSMVIFRCVSRSTLTMLVFKPSGIQAVLPLEESDKCGYDCDDINFFLSVMKDEHQTSESKVHD